MFSLHRLNNDHITGPLGITSAIAIIYATYQIVSNYKDRQRFKNIPMPGSNYPIVGMYIRIRFFFSEPI